MRLEAGRPAERLTLSFQVWGDKSPAQGGGEGWWPQNKSWRWMGIPGGYAKHLHPADASVRASFHLQLENKESSRNWKGSGYPR